MKINRLTKLIAILTACILSACGGGGSSTEIRVSGPASPTTVVQTVAFDISDFSEVAIGGPFNVSLLQGSEFSVEITLDSDDVNALDVHKNGQTLNIGFQSNINVQVETLEATVVMPALSRIQMGGATDVMFSGFSGSALEVEMVGAAFLEGLNVAYDFVTINAAGASALLMEEVQAMPAVHAVLTGSTTATINLMDNANLTGSLTAASSVLYYGSDVFDGVDTDLNSSVQRLGDTRPNQ